MERSEWRGQAIVQTLWLPIAVLVLWQVAASNSWVNPFFFPPPVRVFAAGAGMAASGELISILGVTLSRYLIGVTLGVISGIGCGILMGLSVAGRRALEPFVAALYATPKLTLLPLLMLLLGIGDLSKITLIALVGFIFLSTQTLDAIRGVKASYVEMASNYGAGHWDLLRRVYLPAALPQIFTGLRIAFSRSLVVAISLELVTGTNGLGGLIWLSWETLATDRLFVGILLAGLMGISMHWAFSRAERRLVPWRT